jgi:hypothetical protein
VKFVYDFLNTLFRWATADPTPEERASEIARKTVVGQWEKKFDTNGERLKW